MSEIVWRPFVRFVGIEWSTPYTDVLDPVALGEPPGDRSGLEDPAALDAIMGAR